MTLSEILKLNHELTFNDDTGIIRGFLMAFDYNEKHQDKLPLNTYNAHKACDKLQNLLRKCLFCIGDFIPPVEGIDKDAVYSVRSVEKPPFVARTNDSEVVNKIYELFINLGGWENAKFLLENLRLNKDIGNAE